MHFDHIIDGDRLGRTSPETDQECYENNKAGERGNNSYGKAGIR
jgi:hypothetical protein